MMSGKSISNSTLSLRFMQNAQRAKLQAQVEAEQAKIKDDAEWSVPQEVRDAWGIGSSSGSSSQGSARCVDPDYWTGRVKRTGGRQDTLCHVRGVVRAVHIWRG